MSRVASIDILPSRKSRLRRPVLMLLAAAPVIFGIIAMGLGQSVNWDLRNYHWYNAYAFVTGRYASGIDFAPSQLQFFHNPLIEVPFYLLATYLPIKAAFFLLAFAQGLNFPLLFMLAWALLNIADERRKAAACVGLAFLGMAGGMGIGEIGAPFYDNIASLGVLGSALLVVRHFHRFDNAPWKEALLLAALAGIPLGLATGLKMTTAVFCVGFCAGLFFAFRLTERGLALAVVFGFGIVAGWLVTYGYWGWYLWTHYQSPMFPYFNRIFHSPYVGLGYIEDFAAPRGLLRPLLYPFLFSAKPRLVSEQPFSDWRVPILYVLMIVAGALALIPRKKSQHATPVSPENFLLWGVAVSYVVWMSAEAYYRYLLPVEMLAPLLIVLCARRLPLRAEFKTALAIVLLVLVACSVKPADWGRRGAWAGSISKIERPDIHPGTMILMAGYNAYAYMIPEFPPDIPFVRLQSRAFEIDNGWRILDLIRQRLAAHKGKFMLLIPSRWLPETGNVMYYFHLKIQPGSCRDVTDDIAENDGDPDFPKNYLLCGVVKDPHS